MKTIINIEGLHCEGCVNRIEKILKAKEAIKSVKVSLETKTAEVEYENITIEEIIEMIENAGFEAKVKQRKFYEKDCSKN